MMVCFERKMITLTLIIEFEARALVSPSLPLLPECYVTQEPFTATFYGSIDAFLRRALFD